MDEKMLKAMVAAGAIKKINMTHWQPNQKDMVI